MLISIGKQIAVLAMTAALGIIRDILGNKKSTSHVRPKKKKKKKRRIPKTVRRRKYVRLNMNFCCCC